MSNDGRPDLEKIRRLAARGGGTPIPRAGAAPRASPSARPTPISRGLARFPFVAILIATLLVLVSRLVPEVLPLPLVHELLGQLSPIAIDPTAPTWMVVLWLLGIAAAAMLAERRSIGGAAVAAGLVVLLAQFIGVLRALSQNDDKATIGIGLVLSAVVAFVVILAIRSRWYEEQNATAPEWRPVPVVLAVVFAVPAVAVGRWLGSNQLFDAIRSGGGDPWTINDFSTLWAWGLGASALVTASLGLHAVMAFAYGSNSASAVRRARPGRIATVILALVLTAVGVFYLGPHTAAVSADTYARLVSTPTTDLPVPYCATWDHTSEAEGRAWTTVAEGADCSSTRIYYGGLAVAGADLGVSLDAGGSFTPIDPNLGTNYVVSANYGGIITAGATNDSLVGVIGIDPGTGRLVWTSWCPPGAASVGLRFSATGHEDASALRWSNPGEGPGVFLNCDGDIRVLNPQTGLAG